MEISHGEEEVEGKCMKDKGHDHSVVRGVKFHSPVAFGSKILCRASKSFDNLCSTFLIYSISEKNLGHVGK